MNGKIISVFVAVMLCSIAITGCIETDTKESEPIYQTIVHNDPIYGVEYHNEPVYETEYHKDPIYSTVYTYELDDVGDGDSSYIVDNVYDLDYEYTGSDFWGYANYKVEIHYYNGMTKSVKTYYEINSFNQLGSTEIITGYDSWSEQVIIRYDTYSEDVITGYNTWSEIIIVGYT